MLLPSIDSSCKIQTKVISCLDLYVRKTDQIVTLGLFYFIGPANSYTHNTAHSQCHYQAWLTGLLF